MNIDKVNQVIKLKCIENHKLIMSRLCVATNFTLTNGMKILSKLTNEMSNRKCFFNPKSSHCEKFIMSNQKQQSKALVNF